MKTLALLALLTAAGCRPHAGGQLTGAPSPRAAVESFLSAVRAQDIQALTNVWGDERGPARDRLSRDEVDKRSLIMQCFFNHDRYRIVSDATNQSGQHVFRIELTKGALTRATNFTTTRGPSQRWYVEMAETTPVKDLCEGVSK